ncbi:uncharacterized protein DUF5011 [Thiogranum longum]|uniref:Uncharacterized protein DUF5011 n=1 Tax=Thiogranum longum TaxID=1537524 RepID=A0A4R1HF46_9GAMM|nr:DUF5011 domain-containing protein [Thiogranum longum]TCK19381.1 uncharacterized protein DUF5011 [Thiogranum longum]
MHSAQCFKTKKRILAAAVLTALSAAAVGPARADVQVYDWTGTFTMINPANVTLVNTDVAGNPTKGNQTEVTGTFTYRTGSDDLVNGGGGSGDIAIDAFNFFGGGPAVAHDATFIAIGDGHGFNGDSSGISNGPGDLLKGDLLFDWNGTNNIVVEIIWNAGGFLTSDMGLAGGVGSSVVAGAGAIAPDYESRCVDITFGVCTIALDDPAAGATEWINPADGTLVPDASAFGLTTDVSGGPILLATVDGNPFAQESVDPDGPGNPIPPVNRHIDGLSGIAMDNGPFPGFGANFDVRTMMLTAFTDTTPPVVTLSPNSISINQGDAFDPLAPPGVTITVVDVVDGTLDVATDCSITNGVLTGAAGNYTVTYNCSDLSANANADNGSEGVLNVQVVAAGAPIITLSGNASVTQECGVAYTDAGASCTDALLNPITAPADFFLDTSALNVSTLGVQSVTWSCTDTGGGGTTTVDRVVTVVDTSAPVISLNGAASVAIEEGSVYTDAGATATDGCDVGLPALTVVNTVDTSVPSTYLVTYSVSDASGNPATASRTVEVQPSAPAIVLQGNQTVNLNVGDTFDPNNPGAVCSDAQDATAPVVSVASNVDVTQPGTYEAVYSCTDTDGNTASVTRNVIVQGAGFFSAVDSNFTMLTPTGDFQNGANDIVATWDGTFNTSVSDSNFNMTLATATPTPYEGSVWTAHNIRVFGPGSYQFDVDCTPAQIQAGITDCPVTDLDKPEGRVLTLDVGPNQLGAHILFDWSTTSNIDVVNLWNIDGAFTSPSGFLGVTGRIFNLVSIDANGNNFSGVPMVDGPFIGFHANFNLDFNPPIQPAAGVRAPILGAIQNGATRRAVLVTDGIVTVSTDIGTTFDWSATDDALDGGATVTTSSLSFDPASVAPGFYSVGVTIDSGLSSEATGSLILEVVASVPSVGLDDSDNDGIPDSVDDSGPANSLLVDAGDATLGSIISSPGTSLSVGNNAYIAGIFGGSIPSTDLPSDSGVEESCIGGCFDFQVSGVSPGGSVMVVLPLSEPLPGGSVYRKYNQSAGTWVDFGVGAGNAIASAGKIAGGLCPDESSASYDDTLGLVAGDECIRLTIVDGGANDMDSAANPANGIVYDPGGAGVPATPVFASPSTSLGSASGCTVVTAPIDPRQRGDWWLLAMLLGLLGFHAHMRRSRH